MNLKAISPVIATVIIVSVAIAIAVAVAFWMTGITGLFTRYEKLEVVTAYATTTKPTGSGVSGSFYVILEIKNTGTTDATIDNVFINGKPYGDVNAEVAYQKGASWTIFTGNVPVTTGSSVKMVVALPDTFISGQIVEVKIHTASGNEYPKSVQLP